MNINTNDGGFYRVRDFNVVGKPLLYTESRSKLRLIKSDYLTNLSGSYGISVKRDGKFVRLIKKGMLIRMITSGGLDFYHNRLAEIMQPMLDGQYNCEFIHGDGRLKSRDGTGYLTTAVTNYRKELPEAGDWEDASNEFSFEVHDFLEPHVGWETGYKTYHTFEVRQEMLEYSMSLMESSDVLLTKTKVAVVYKPQGAISWGRNQGIGPIPSLLFGHDLGYDSKIHEGLVIMGMHSYYELPYNNDGFKLKNLNELVGVVDSTELNRDGGIGVLILELTSPKGKGIPKFCRVSSGINDSIREMSNDELVGKVVEVDYESITDGGEFNQPRIKRFDVDTGVDNETPSK